MEHLEQTLLTAAFVVPFLLSLTILIDAKGNLPKRVIGVALFNAFFVFLANYFYFRKLITIYIVLHSLHIASVLWLFPSIYLYVKAIVSEEKTFKKELFHLLPGLLFGLGSAILFYGLLNQNERIYYLNNYRTDLEFTDYRLKVIYAFRMVDVAVIVLQVVYYSVVLIKIPDKYHRRLYDEYSNIENFSISWLKWFNVSFVGIGLLSILFYVFNPLDAKNDVFLVFFLCSISVFIWIIGIWSFKQKKPASIPQFRILSVQEEVGDIHLREKDLAQKLLDYFEKEQPFLDTELNLTTVSRNIGTNRTYLSNLINANFGMNFNAFVNQYRVEYIKEYLKVNSGTTNENLASVGGFGSVSSLKRAMAKSKPA